MAAISDFKCLTRLVAKSRALFRRSWVAIRQPLFAKQEQQKKTWGSGYRGQPLQRPQRAEGAELFKYVCVAQDGCFRLDGIVLWLMGGDAETTASSFAAGKPTREEFTGAGNRIRDMVPTSEFIGVRWAVAEEDSEVMHPGGGEENVVVESPTPSDTEARA